jgi:hypothetical protein
MWVLKIILFNCVYGFFIDAAVCLRLEPKYVVERNNVRNQFNSPIIPLLNIGRPQESSVALYSSRRTSSLHKSFFIPLASSSTVLRHVFFGLPLPRLPCGFHSRACLVISSIGFRSVWPSHPQLRFLICNSIRGCFVRFHNSLFVIWSGQNILKIFLKLMLMKTCSLVVIYFEFFQVSHPQSKTFAVMLQT